MKFKRGLNRALASLLIGNNICYSLSLFLFFLLLLLLLLLLGPRARSLSIRVSVCMRTTRWINVCTHSQAVCSPQPADDDEWIRREKLKTAFGNKQHQWLISGTEQKRRKNSSNNNNIMIKWLKTSKEANSLLAVSVPHFLVLYLS